MAAHQHGRGLAERGVQPLRPVDGRDEARLLVDGDGAAQRCGVDDDDVERAVDDAPDRTPVGVQVRDGGELRSCLVDDGVDRGFQW
jgi:hypothetical protein